jgi:hypothetical protein
MRLVPLALACFVFSASAAALVSAVANAKIYEDPHKSLAQLSDEFKAVAAAPAARFKAGLNRGGRRAASRDAVRSVCLTPPCETEDIMVRKSVHCGVVRLEALECGSCDSRAGFF